MPPYSRVRHHHLSTLITSYYLTCFLLHTLLNQQRRKPHNDPTMKRAWNILFFAFFIVCLFLFKPREDVVFAAINKSQCIRLFENNKDFELCVEESLRYTGTYTISDDTVFLYYRQHKDLSQNKRNTKHSDFSRTLPLKLLIKRSTSNITACDGKTFSAEVYLDLRQKSYPASPRNIRLLNHPNAIISAVSAQP